MTTGLHLIRLPVNMRALSRWAADRNLGLTSGGDFDDGRALHHLLSETFGKGRLQPFRLMVEPRGDMGSLYGYCRADAAVLREEAWTVAPPEHLSVVDLAALADKPMPDDWRAGRRLGFDIRARPVRRLLTPLAEPGGRPFAKGDEVDAYLVEALRRPADGDAPSREAVYATWLADRLAGAASLTVVRLDSFRRHAASRKSRQGRAATLEGPDALLRGDLEIIDPDAFRLALEKGVGRHRAYGFGMLLLRPASGGREGC